MFPFLMEEEDSNPRKKKKNNNNQIQMQGGRRRRRRSKSKKETQHRWCYLLWSTSQKLCPREIQIASHMNYMAQLQKGQHDVTNLLGVHQFLANQAYSQGS